MVEGDYDLFQHILLFLLEKYKEEKSVNMFKLMRVLIKVIRIPVSITIGLLGTGWIVRYFIRFVATQFINQHWKFSLSSFLDIFNF